MIKRWMPGEAVALRGIYNNRVWYMQTALVVHDTPEEIVLAVLPGAECSAPVEYIHGKHGALGHYDRWGNYLANRWNMEKYLWRTNRLLILLEPEKYYSRMFFWEHKTGDFRCYYINFQLPFHRSEIGFDTLDLELDIVIEPTLEWFWKDVENYQKGIHCGVIRGEWTEQIEKAKQEVFQILENRDYPFDGSWRDWKPNPAWQPPRLLENWDKI
jgi:hypothetical protein